MAPNGGPRRVLRGILKQEARGRCDDVRVHRTEANMRAGVLNCEAASNNDPEDEQGAWKKLGVSD